MSRPSAPSTEPHVVPSDAAPTMGDAPGPWRRSQTRKVVLFVAIVVFVVFWAWALFFASKEAVNRIDDDAWSERAEAICAEYDAQLRTIEARREAAPEARAQLVIESTDLMSAMLDEIVAVTPVDEKGQAIVPEWEADYRTLLADRYRYAERLSAGENVPFTETAVDGVPITERIETFAGDNAMPSCAPPRGSII